MTAQTFELILFVCLFVVIRNSKDSRGITTNEMSMTILIRAN